MRKQVFGRHLKRDINERKALFRNLASALIMHERIETTEEKAKSIRSMVEKMVTKAKSTSGMQAERLLQGDLSNDALKKMMKEIAPRFVNRPGGYTRIIKIGNRFSDNANMVVMEWVERPAPVVKETTKKGKKETAATDEVAAQTAAPEKEAKAKAKPAKKEASKKETTKKETKKPAPKKEKKETK